MAGEDGLPAALFTDPVLTALESTHGWLAEATGEAMRYPAEVAPFAAVKRRTPAVMRELAGLVAPGEAVWVFGEDLPEVPELRNEATLPCLQMVLAGECRSEHAAGTRHRHAVEPMGEETWDEMLALIAISYPGFFRRRTPEMGRYFGIREAGRLVAMGGERLRMPGYAEISGLCTHPEHRGRGHAARLLEQLAGLHRDGGIVSFLHVSAGNEGAIGLYERMGFEVTRQLPLQRLSRPARVGEDLSLADSGEEPHRSASLLRGTLGV